MTTQGGFLMNMLAKVIGPASRYIDDIPYSYEARVPIIEQSGEYNSYVADTICALVGHLRGQGIGSDEVAIYEVYRERERRLDIGYCTDRLGSWLSREQLCESLKLHYPNHIWEGDCSFSDRAQQVAGP